MTGWTVMLGGIRHRLGRSLLVLVIATVATGSAVATAAYVRAAQQSVLDDGLRSAPTYRTDIVVSGNGQAALPSSQEPDLSEAALRITQAYGTVPVLAGAVAPAIAAEDVEAFVRAGSGGLATLGYRAGVCAHLTITGRCPAAAGEVIMSQRTADRAHLAVGATIRIQVGVRDNGTIPPPSTPANTLTATVVGIYTPQDAQAGYWYGDPYFTFGPDPNSPSGQRYDTVFTGAEQDVRYDPSAPTRMHVEIPFRAGALRVGDVTRLRSELDALTAALAGGGLATATGLTLVLDEVAAAQHALATTVPVAAVPLVVLGLFVLFLVVAALSEERAPELALAKLRGFTASAALRFGTAEMLLLILLAGPLGLAAGMAGVEAVAKLVLARGTGVELRWPLVAAAAGSVVAGWIAAWLATRVRLRQGVLALMRRVPARAGWRGSAVLGAVLAIVAGSLVAAATDRSSPLAWLAAPSIAVIAGLACARLVAIVAARRLRAETVHREIGRPLDGQQGSGQQGSGRPGGGLREGRRGVVRLLAGAWVARQPGRSRVVAVLTTAIALLVFGAIGWDVAAQARHDSATDALGADRVYDVVAPFPEALMGAVRAADPGGDAMAVAWTSTFFNGAQVPLYAVDTRALAKVALWRGEPRADVARLAAALRPALAPPLQTTGRITVAITADDAVPDATIAIEALVEHTGSAPAPVALGFLHDGAGSYTGTLTGCGGGCRFLGLDLSRSASGPGGSMNIDMKLTRIDLGASTVGDFSDGTYWASASQMSGSSLTLTPGPALDVDLDTGTQGDELITYVDSPLALPVVVSGGAKDADPNASRFSFPGLDSDPTPMAVVGRSARIPVGGANALLADLTVASDMAERSGSLTDNVYLAYQVWADANAPADLGRRLAAQGVTVLSSQSVAGYVGQLSRNAPTLSFWFYLVSGVIALLLAIGVVLLGTHIGAEGRIYAYAALRLAGVPERTLRASMRREYRWVLATALIVGTLAGVLGAVLMLPSIPLVTAGGATGNVPYGGHMVAFYVALAATVLAMSVMVALATRLVRRATPDRTRNGIQ